MSKAQTRKIHTFAAGLLFLAPWVSAYAQSTSSQVQPDNTKVNQRDRNQGEVTADQQKMNPEDRALSAKIRQAIVADKALSTYAHNIMQSVFRPAARRLEPEGTLGWSSPRRWAKNGLR